MGILNEVVVKPHFKNPKVHSEGTNDAECIQNNLLFHLKPAGLLCRLFGVFPYTLNHRTETITSSNTNLSGGGSTLFITYNRRGWFFYTFLIFLVTSCYMAFQLVSLIICTIEEGHDIIQLAAQSLWFISPLSTFALSICTFTRGGKLGQIFEECEALERDLQKLFCPIMTRRHIMRFQRAYLALATISNAFCVFHAIKQPRTPVYPFYYLREDQYNEMHHWIYVIFQMLIIGWMWAGLFVLEGICCLFATVFIQCMETMEAGLDFQSLKDVNEKDADNSSTDHAKFVRKAVRNIMEIGTANKPASAQQGGISEEYEKSQGPFKDPGELSKLHKEGYIIFVVKKMQTVAALQAKVNKLVGPLLLIDVGQLVVLSCVLLFLPIRFGAYFDIDSTMAFAGNAITVFSRLFIFIVCLGNVYTKSQDVNLSLAKAMASSSLSTSCQNPVLAHLTVFSANPISFSAMDFFPVTRGTLLAALSVISTYAVVFFQLKF